MQPIRARTLGHFLALARYKARLSVRQVAEQCGLSPSWLTRLERGDFEHPDPARLACLAEILSIDPREIDDLTGGAVSAGLPATQTYLRAKYGNELTEAHVGQVETLVERLRKASNGT